MNTDTAKDKEAAIDRSRWRCRPWIVHCGCGFHKCARRPHPCTMDESRLSVFHQLLPRVTAKAMLKHSDALIVSVREDFSVDGVVGNTEGAPLISICYVQNF